MQRDHFYHDGQWKNLQDRMQAISDNGKIVLPYYAKDAHIVATGPDVVVQILLDGKKIKSDYSGQDPKMGLYTYQNTGCIILCQVHSPVRTQ